MTTYKEQQKDKKYFVLLKANTPLGTFGNLKKVVEFIVDNFEEDGFPSYWTLVRKSENPIITGDYKIYKVNHY